MNSTMSDLNPYESAVISPAPGAKPRWRPLCVATLLILAGTWYYSEHIYATNLSRAADLESYVGRRVAFRGTFNGDAKAYDLVHFGGKPVIFRHVLGAHPQPRTGQNILVVGRLERTSYLGIEYVLREARWRR